MKTIYGRGDGNTECHWCQRPIGFLQPTAVVIDEGKVMEFHFYCINGSLNCYEEWAKDLKEKLQCN